MPFRHSVEKDRKRILFGIEAPTFWGFTTQDVSKSSCAKYSSLEIRNWRVLLGALQPNSGRSSSTQFSCRHQPGLGNRRAKGCVELRSRNWGWRRWNLSLNPQRHLTETLACRCLSLAHLHTWSLAWQAVDDVYTVVLLDTRDVFWVSGWLWRGKMDRCNRRLVQCRPCGRNCGLKQLGNVSVWAVPEIVPSDRYFLAGIHFPSQFARASSSFYPFIVYLWCISHHL